MGENHIPADHIPATRYRIKNVDTYEIPVSEFNRIKQEGRNVGTDLQFATAFIPVAITLSITMATVPLPKDRTFIVILVAMLVSWGFGLYFSVSAWRRRGRFDQLMEDLRQLQVGPLGESGKELHPSELASLPGQPVGPIQLPLEAVTNVSTIEPVVNEK